MDNDREDPPPPKEPHHPGQQREPRRGYLGPGLSFGALALYILYLWATIGVGAPNSWPTSILAGPAAFVPIALYLGLGIALAVRPGTARTGAGMLIGLGIFLLLGGGLCVGVLAQARI